MGSCTQLDIECTENHIKTELLQVNEYLIMTYCHKLRGCIPRFYRIRNKTILKSFSVALDKRKLLGFLLINMDIQLGKAGRHGT